MNAWRADPLVLIAAVCATGAYAAGVVRYGRRDRRIWPAMRSGWFAAGIISGLIAIESPLDAAGDARFAPHMVQHLILTDITAPCLLLGSPLLLFFNAVPVTLGRAVARVLHGPIGRVLTFPALTWAVFIVTLWVVHYTAFFEAALESEFIHILEHALYLGTALVFWLPVIDVGPTPWSAHPLAYPLRMLYVLAAMPAEAVLGFTLYSARHVLYPHYAAAGLEDQQFAGEIMWIGGSAFMFIAFMIVGYGWAQHEQRLGERADRRA